MQFKVLGCSMDGLGDWGYILDCLGNGYVLRHMGHLARNVHHFP